MVKEYTKKLSIIVPVYNAEEYIEDCVNSLLKQDLSEQEYEIILINDGSTDNSPKLAQKLKEQNNNIVLLSQENKGQSVARNKGMDIAKGKYIMFVDSDDMLLPNVLNKILTVSEEKDLDVCAYRMFSYDSKGNVHESACQPFKANKVYDGKYAFMHGADIGSSCIYLYNHTFLIKNNLRFLEGIYHEDVDFVLRMYAFVKRIMYLDVVAYSYTWNPDSTDRNINYEKIIKQFHDEFKIIENIKLFVDSYVYDKEFKGFYNKYNNSILISLFLRIILNKNINKDTKKILLRKMRKMFCPIHGSCRSWKTSLLIPFVNVFLFTVR